MSGHRGKLMVNLAKAKRKLFIEDERPDNKRSRTEKWISSLPDISNRQQSMNTSIEQATNNILKILKESKPKSFNKNFISGRQQSEIVTSSEEKETNGLYTDEVGATVEKSVESPSSIPPLEGLHNMGISLSPHQSKNEKIKSSLKENHPFSFVNCKCFYRKCSKKLDFASRIKLHEDFSALDWLSQRNYISFNVKTFPVKNRNFGKQQIARKYYLNDIEVCKAVFSATLGISYRKIDYTLNVKANCSRMISPDRRGKHEPKNKTPIKVKDEILQFLDSIPKYKSHYSLNNKRYFSPNLSKSKLYEIYLKNSNVQEENSIKVSYKIFSKVLNSYNIGFYIPKTDTCQKCDKLKISLSNNDEKDKELLEIEKFDHLLRAENARSALKVATEISKQDDSYLVFTFDMQKTQPIPYLNTSVAFYKRTLWLYNLGINITKSNKGYMHIWHEGEAKRGSNEVCSAILYFLSNIDLTKIKNVYTFSDGCGGQNRNRNMIVFLFYVVKKFDLKSWQHTYLESGHSYLPNDSDFSHIEKSKKYHNTIYSIDEWMDLILKCKKNNPFIVNKIGEKIKDFSNLTNNFSFKIKDLAGSKFNWFDLKYFKIEAGSTVISYKYDNDPNSPSSFIDFGRIPLASLPEEIPNANYKIKISKPKYDDLISLLPYVPAIHHDFFENLQVQKNKVADEFIPDENEELLD